MRPSAFFVVPGSRRIVRVFRLICAHFSGRISDGVRQPARYANVHHAAQFRRERAPDRLKLIALEESLPYVALPQHGDVGSVQQLRGLRGEPAGTL